MTEKTTIICILAGLLNMLSPNSGKFFGSTTGYRGPYISAFVLLNLLNELGKRDKMRGLPSILSLFRNKFLFRLDSIYHLILRLL